MEKDTEVEAWDRPKAKGTWQGAGKREEGGDGGGDRGERQEW